MPNGKAGYLDQIQYEHLEYGGKACCDILTVVLNSVREIESVPESLTTEITLSLFKGKKKSKLDKDSYRGITLLSVIGKIFERLILQRNMATFNRAGVPNKVQFAYQESNSCIMSSFALQEVINHYKEEGSNIYCCFLDAPKAFDCVWIDGLLFKLFSMGIKRKTLRIIRNWYSKLSCCVMVEDLISAPFQVQQGIRQGGVLSPWLCMCYINDITEMQDNRNCGSVIQSIGTISNVTIADDVTLISPRVKGLQKMIDALEEYGNMWQFLFNLSKTAVVTFGESSTDYRKNKINRTFFLHKQRFPEKQACDHAGIIPSGNFSSTLRTKEMIHKGKESVPSLMNVGVRPGGLNPICGAEV